MSTVAESAARTAPQADGTTRATLAELIALRQQLPRQLAAPLDVVRSVRAGGHASTLRGRGMDYRESRAYQPGDDVRRLDWRLTARSGRLHTKLFQEERERSLMLLIDTHASMQFGTRRRFKSVQAARAAALAAWLGATTGMRVGVAGFGPQRSVLRPRGSAHGALAVLHTLCSWQDLQAPADAQDEPLSAALQRLTHLARKGSQVLVISDGFSSDDAARAGLIRLQRQAGISMLVVADALETDLPPAGRYPLAWKDRIRQLDLTGAGARSMFRDCLAAGPGRLQKLAAELTLRNARIDTREMPLAAVAHVMGIRLHRRAR